MVIEVEIPRGNDLVGSLDLHLGGWRGNTDHRLSLRDGARLGLLVAPVPGTHIRQLLHWRREDKIR